MHLRLLAAALALAATGACAGPASADAAPAQAVPLVQTPPPPKLVVAISVDQFSADLFAQYREHYTGGLARLLSGAAFPSGYQSHAATETCPGHSTIMTGAHPSRTGIIANDWMAKDAGGTLAEVYCAEDEAHKPASGDGYTPSAVHLLVPTFGEMLKAKYPKSRNVAVAGKDRAALMMGGKSVDTIYFRWGPGYGTIEGKTLGPEAQAVTAGVQQLIASGAPALDVPAWCTAVDRPIALPGQTVGTNHFEIKPGDANGFIRSPRFDRATLDLATRVLDAQKLGQGAAPDVLSIGLSATDYVGHAYGPGGVESCIQVAAVDHMLGEFFAHLDATGVDYMVVLTADHGGLDLPERASIQGVPQARRVDKALLPGTLGKAIGAELGIAGDVLEGSSPAGDVWLDPALSPADRARVIAALKTKLSASPDVAAVYSGEELASVAMPSGDDVRRWTLEQRARESYYPGRSGDVIVLLSPEVTPIATPGPGYVSTHGSPWDYDRRVPILFWRKGMAHMEQPFAVETVDIAPTLAAIYGLTVTPGTFDGRCLDLDAGSNSTCDR